ncbi:hypothetical protein ACFPM3_11995 [Streptomyces coeruleoprunus]|uniref:Uncharacterized protein n=1 Tax=Streptomyces coeruleoprunus TaxID=285563 RepID=A0ABV9XDM0_9ACTN
MRTATGNRRGMGRNPRTGTARTKGMPTVMGTATATATTVTLPPVP